MIFVSAALALIAVAGGVLALFWPTIQRSVRETTIEKLEERYDGTAELESMTFSIFPSPRIVGEGVVIRHEGRTDVPPLIQVERFTARFTPWGLLADPVRIEGVDLEGLEIQITRRKDDDERSENPERGEKSDPAEKYPFLIGEILADGTRLSILPDEEGKEPLVWDIRELYLESVGLDRPMAYEAELVNAKPPGVIQTTGLFGPWLGEDPGGTPVEGDYRFENADLAVFKGISGILSSTGDFKGHLSRIEADGSTDTTDFRVGEGQPVHLTTVFHAVIDGTNGDTLLEPVQARFLNTSITARGGVVEREEDEGKAISLDVTVSQARVEDLIVLVLGPETPPLTGDIEVRTQFELPTGEAEVIDRLELNGDFKLASAEFSGEGTQSKLEELSWRARGRPDEEEDSLSRVVSNMKGQFILDDAKISFKGLTFEIPGAQVLMDGKHDLHQKTLDFKGKLRMEAKVSQAVGGFKSIFLKVVDPFFKKNGAGAEIPVKVEGTIDEPKFGVDF